MIKSLNHNIGPLRAKTQTSEKKASWLVSFGGCIVELVLQVVDKLQSGFSCSNRKTWLLPGEQVF